MTYPRGTAKQKKIITTIFIIACAFSALLFALWYGVSREISLIDKKVFDTTEKKAGSSIDTTHLASGLIPPTNKWFSGIALQKEPKTIFPTPYAVSITENSFAYGLPTIVPTTDAITGGIAEKVTITIQDAVSYQIENYDELSVTIAYKNTSQETLGTVLLMAGSPYIQFTSVDETELTSSSTLGPAKTDRHSFSYQSLKGSYTIVVKGGSVSSQTISLDKDGLLTAYVAPDKSSADILKSYAANKLSGAEVSYKKNPDGFETKFSVNTSGQTLLSLLPHQYNENKALFSYDTLYGKQRVYEGREFVFTTPSIPISDKLPIASLSGSDKQLLIATLHDDVAATKYRAYDTYYSGKELYRNAQLVELANQLGEDSLRQDALKKLGTEMNAWLSDDRHKTTKKFYYDSQLKSIVGEMPSFGSEIGNDHHFHYGYFIYAAAILAKYDTNFLKMHGSKVNLLIADIANYHDREVLPLRRNFDPYFGHSWAAGNAPFNDGNNQESSSEALNAWVATGLWGEVTRNSKLRMQSEWMLSNESVATKKYWMDIDIHQKPYDNIYTHSLVSLNWSGKREYGTFFSSEPTAKLGIQLIPFGPTIASISAGNTNAKQHISEAVKNGYSQPFGDYILMYNPSLTREQKLKIARALPDAAIDGANSRTYLYSLILSQN